MSQWPEMSGCRAAVAPEYIGRSAHHMPPTSDPAPRPPEWQTPEHWLNRAEEALTLAAQFTDPNVRANLISIAEGYRRMAEHAAATIAANSRR